MNQGPLSLNQLYGANQTSGVNNDIIKGINVGNALKQAGSYLGLAPAGDYDIFDSVTLSNRPGQTNLLPGTAVPYPNPPGTYRIPEGPIGSGPINPQANDTTTYGGYGSAAAQNNAIAQFNQSAGIVQNALDRLPGQLDIARGNINTAYNTGINELNSQRSANEQNYSQSSLQNSQNLRSNKNTINDQASQGLRGLMRILGSYGAVGSDLGLAGRTVADVASAQNAGAGQNFSQNQQNLDTNWGNYKSAFDNEKRKRDDWRTGQLNQAEAQSSSTRQDLLSKLAAIRGDEAAARGGSYVGAAQPYLDQANALSARIDELGRINPTYTGNTPTYTAAPLSSYSAGNGAVTSLQDRVQGGLNTPFLNMLLGRDRRENQVGY